jgi:hypothetical protein
MMLFISLVRGCTCLFKNTRKSNASVVVLGGVMVIVLAIGRKVRGFKPGRGQWIFKDDKIPQLVFRRRGSKAVGPMT